MIVGNYYINNFLVLGVVFAVAGGTAYVADVPGMLDGGSSPENPSKNYDISLLGGSTESGTSQVIRFVRSNGSTVSGAEVFVNGEEIGVTSESGELAFEVPDSENMTVSASKSGVEVTRTFDVEGSQQGEEDDRSDESSDGSDEEDSGQDGSEDQQNDEDTDSDQDNSTQEENETSEGNKSFQPTFIEKVRPENSELQSSSFEIAFDLGANSSQYQISLGGQQELSGEVDGNKTVSSNLEMPRNGTVGLLVEILKNEEVKASKNYSLTYNSETGEDEGGDNGSEVENNVTAEISPVGTVSVGQQFALDASNSTGEIDTYSWQLGNGDVQTTQSPVLDYSYSETGTYEVSLTVEGPNSSTDSTAISVSVEQEESSTPDPEINFISPVEGLETDQKSLDYEFEVRNASSSSTYRILIDGTEKISSGLNEGTNTVQETVSVPSELFNTSIEVEQGGQVYISERRTVNATGSADAEPQYSLKYPEENGVVETLDSQTSVSFEYEVNNREWAREASFTLSNNSGVLVERPVSVSEGNHTEEVSGLNPGDYTYNVALGDGDRTVTKSNAFTISKVEPQYSISQLSPEDGVNVGSENPNDFQDVKFNVSYKTDTDAVLHFEIIALEDGSNTYTTDSGTGGEQQWTTEYNQSDVVDSASVDILSGMEYHKVFENTFDVAIRYEWRSWITVDGEVVKSTDRRSLNVTEEPS